MSKKDAIVNYRPEPTGAAFMAYNGRLKGIMGPVGSGKSSVCIMNLFRFSCQQAANPDGIRRTRWMIIRATYSELDQTTIKTFKNWIPDSVCPINRDYPRVGTARFMLPDGTQVEAEFIFLALDGEKAVEKVKSTDITGGWINEASEIDQSIFEAAYSRKARFPLKEWDNGYKERATWSGFLLDTNPPPISHWYAHFAEHEETKGAFFRQPPAVIYNDETGSYEVNEDAENISHLDDSYYSDMLKIHKVSGNVSFIRVMLQGEYGQIQRGVPIFGHHFSDVRHVDHGMRAPNPQLPIVVGLDWGLNFAAAFTQMDHMGQLRIFEEIFEEDVSLEEMIATKLRPLVNGKYRGFKFLFIGDPAGRGRSSNDKRTPFMLMNEAGLSCKPALTNDFVIRRDAVVYFMTRVNGLRISKTCKKIIDSLGVGYILDNSGEKAEKNEHSHPADAVQYAALFHKYGLTKKKKKIAGARPKRRKLV